MNDASSVDVHFCEAVLTQELHPSLVEQGEERVIAQMAPIVDVSDAKGNFGDKLKSLW
jgi:hypothetical protein